MIYHIFSLKIKGNLNALKKPNSQNVGDFGHFTFYSQNATENENEIFRFTVTIQWENFNVFIGTLCLTLSFLV